MNNFATNIHLLIERELPDNEGESLRIHYSTDFCLEPLETVIAD